MSLLQQKWRNGAWTQTDRPWVIYHPVKIQGGNVFGLFQRVPISTKYLWAHLQGNFWFQTKDKKREKENDSFVVKNHIKYMGLLPPRPFFAYQTTCMFYLFPWQRNLEFVYTALFRASSLPSKMMRPLKRKRSAFVTLLPPSPPRLKVNEIFLPRTNAKS